MSEVLDFYFSCVFNVDISSKNYKFKVLQIPYKQFGINFGKKSIVDYAHHYGIALQYWTVNKERHLKHLVNIGADAVITDFPDLAYEIINRK
jgi:glycerophosphoryl diester phosphodiesterase